MTALATTVLPRENDWSYPEMEEDHREARRLFGRTGADWRDWVRLPYLRVQWSLLGAHTLLRAPPEFRRPQTPRLT
jgi:hypothetical protein